jgi:phosphoribosylaminoimidazolecarboxamide formyltransferase/IMP cyclohydrolase
VIAANGPITSQLAEQIAKVLTEVIVAPSYEPDALERLSKRKNTRLLLAKPRPDRAELERRPISGGLLLQTADAIDAPGDDPANWTLAAGDPADEQTLTDLAFAWRAVRAVKSNAILLARDRATVGIGMGQVNRVDSCRLAVSRAGDRAAGSVAASDAFFPFDDGARVLIDAGVRAIVEPGGSIRDDDTIALAKEHGITLYLTGTRHFAH